MKTESKEVSNVPEKTLTEHWGIKKEPVSVSVEESAKNYAKEYGFSNSIDKNKLISFMDGANWQSEQDKQREEQDKAIIGELLDIVKEYDKSMNGYSAQNRLNEQGVLFHKQIKIAITKATNYINPQKSPM